MAALKMSPNRCLMAITFCPFTIKASTYWKCRHRLVGALSPNKFKWFSTAKLIFVVWAKMSILCLRYFIRVYGFSAVGIYIVPFFFCIHRDSELPVALKWPAKIMAPRMFPLNCCPKTNPIDVPQRLDRMECSTLHQSFPANTQFVSARIRKLSCGLHMPYMGFNKHFFPPTTQMVFRTSRTYCYCEHRKYRAGSKILYRHRLRCSE